MSPFWRLAMRLVPTKVIWEETKSKRRCSYGLCAPDHRCARGVCDLCRWVKEWK